MASLLEPGNLSNNHLELIIFTATFYKEKTDLRFKETLKTLDAACDRGFTIVIVDASPDSAIRNLMESTGPLVHVFIQRSTGGKGAALREALSHAYSLPGASMDTFLCWQEPEKSDMMTHWRALIRSTCQASAEIVMPAREGRRFRDYYPIEQWHSENFANHMVNSFFVDAGYSVEVGEPPIDWHFGPLAFQKRHAHFWVENKGELWDAQLIPIVSCLQNGLRIFSREIPFEAPSEMKAQEEGSSVFMEKRLMQINFLMPKLKEHLFKPPVKVSTENEKPEQRPNIKSAVLKEGH